MPYLIKYVDKIAREKHRGVLFLSFIESMDWGEISECDFSKHHLYQDVTAWLDENGIKWFPCMVQGGETLGRIYVDVPFDLDDPEYQKLAGYLENPDGSMKIEGVKFWYLPLETAMQFAYQDESSYWQKHWGE